MNRNMAKQNIIKRIISNPLIPSFLIYVSGGWIVLEITDYIINNYGLNVRVRDVISIILLTGLPVVILLTWYFGRDSQKKNEKRIDTLASNNKHNIYNRIWKRRWFFIPGMIVILMLLVTGIRLIHQKSRIKWAKEEALPKMQKWINEWDDISAFKKAFQLRQEVKEYISEDPEFRQLDTLITKRFTILTEPSGTDVYYKEYNDVKGEWIYLGITPLSNLEMPNWTMFRWKLEKPGYDSVLAVAFTTEDTLFRTMHVSGTIPEGMVYVEGINEELQGNYLSRCLFLHFDFRV